MLHIHTYSVASLFYEFSLIGSFAYKASDSKSRPIKLQTRRGYSIPKPTLAKITRSIGCGGTIYLLRSQTTTTCFSLLKYCLQASSCMPILTCLLGLSLTLFSKNRIKTSPAQEHRRKTKMQAKKKNLKHLAICL